MNEPLKFMKYGALVRGTLVKRYKRFLADIRLEDGTVVVAHCPNSGSMKSCLEQGAEVYCSPVTDPKRKTRYTWEMIRIGTGWVGINTGLPNLIVFDWVREGIIPGFTQYHPSDTDNQDASEGSGYKREVTWEDSRFDIYMRNADEECYMEVKNVTLKVGEMAQFPDSVTTRGQKHLAALIRLRKQGTRAAMLYFVQRMDVEGFAPARQIDPVYAAAFDKAVEAGVEIHVVQAKVTPEGISFRRMLPLV